MLTFIQPKWKVRSIQPTQQCKWCQTIKERKKKKTIQDFDFSGLLVRTLTISLSFSWPASSSQVGGINVCATYKWGWSYTHMWYDQPDLSKKLIYIYIYIIGFKVICFIYLIKRYWIPFFEKEDLEIFYSVVGKSVW